MLKVSDILKTFDPLKQIPKEVKEQFNIHTKRYQYDTFSEYPYIVFESHGNTIKVRLQSIKKVEVSTLMVEIDLTNNNLIILGLASGTIAVSLHNI